MLSTESKIRVLENFHAIDYAIFGRPVKAMASCCEGVMSEYLTLKGALMSTIIEMYKLIDHQPEPLAMKIQDVHLHAMSKQSARIARENAEMLVSSGKGIDDVKRKVRESIVTEGDVVDIPEMVREKIREKAYALSLDNLLIARAVTESEGYKNMNSWEGALLEDAYKILRDSLVESAAFILEYDNIGQ